MLTITPVTAFNAAHFEGFTMSACWSALVSSSFATPFVAVGALWDDRPAGLAVGRIQLDGSARLLTLYAAHDFRGRGIGTALVGGLEAELRRCGCPSVEARYLLQTDGTARFERVLQRCGWPAIGGRRHSFALDGQVMSASWFRNAVLPPDHAIDLWSTVTDGERRALVESQASDPWIPAHLHPGAFEAGLDPATSLVLRRMGSVIGWTLTSEIDERTVYYANVWVHPSRNRVGKTLASLALIADAVHRQAEARGIRSRGLFDVADDHTTFLRFIERHLASDLLWSNVTQRLVKPL